MGYITLAEARDYLGFDSTDSTSDDALIEDIMDAAEAFLEERTGMVFDGPTQTRYYHAINDVDERILRLDRPLLTITTLTNGDGQTIASTEYNKLPYNGPCYYGIELKTESTYSWQWTDSPEAAISVAGTWGYASTVPNSVKHAVKELVGLLYRGKDSQTLGASSAFMSGGEIVLREGLPPWTALVIRQYREML